nr:HAMP domain-containing sensor histidine kinase [Neobacillus sp. Marseille-Q6967]
MDIKWKKYSHSIMTKAIVFILMVTCFTGIVKNFADVEIESDGEFGTVFEEDYYHSEAYIRESEKIVVGLTRLIGEFKNEEHILNGGTINEEELRAEEDNLYSDFQVHSRDYNPNASEDENYKKFKEVYADKLSAARNKLIRNELKEFHVILQNLAKVEGPLYYASDGENVYSNTSMKENQQFKSYPSYMIFEEYKREVYPEEVNENEYLPWMDEILDGLDPSSNAVVYVAFPEEFLNQKIQEWKQDKAIAEKGLSRLLAFLTAFILTFGYLAVVIGRKSFTDREVHLQSIDKLYIDLNLLLCIGLMTLWVGLMDGVNFQNIDKIVIPITLLIAAPGFVLVLSMVRHLKNRTFFKHTLIFTVIYQIIKFIKNVYDSGSVGVKTVLIVIGYPLLVAATFFIFPVTIGFAAWFAFKRVKAFTAIQEGVEKIKDGDIQHNILVGGKGEFARLASNINSITDGLNKAVESELKSERLKTELITNVSHDIRTPLTSIITYVDLLKTEEDPLKAKEYIEVLDQKSQRLKVLTDDLFEAAKASSGSIPVQLERIDIVSLVTQGLGELNDKIEDSDLDFKLNAPKDKVFVTADGKLLWRSIENVLSNIFKYALKGSRVYIDIEDIGHEIQLTFKNISAYELNISADELMERFKRGDESRTSQGSGLGLSIARSLIDNQKGKFIIQVDGDLFKSIILMPKHRNGHE